MGVDSTVFHYLIFYPELVEKEKTHKLCPNILEPPAQQEKEEKPL